MTCIYEHIDLVAFGEHFHRRHPSYIFRYFKDRSPVYANRSLRAYADFFIAMNGLPSVKEGEPFDAWAERVFDLLVDYGMVAYEGSGTSH